MGKNLVIGTLGIALIGLAFLYAQKAPQVSPTTPLQPAPAQEEQEMCAQVITPARNPESGEITEFPTPCDVPVGWEIIQNDIPDLELDLQ